MSVLYSRKLSRKKLDAMGVPYPRQYTHPGFRVVWRRGYALALQGFPEIRCPYSSIAYNYRGVWIAGWREGDRVRQLGLA